MRHVGIVSGIRWGSAVAIAAVLAGCTTQKTPPPASPTPAAAAPATPGPQPIALTRKQRITNALIALNSGEVGTARVGIVETLAEAPGDPVATDLLRQIDTDPKVLLGDKSFAYEIRPRETLSIIAKRFLGSPNRFWALARYNDIAVPSSAGAGRVIQVPGAAPARVAPRPKPVVAPPPRVADAADPAPAPPPRPAGPAPADVAAANRLRASGLDEMARGSIGKAVTLLEQAAARNPDDAAIQTDLARARKVQATVRR